MGPSGFDGFNFMFSVFPIIFVVMFVSIICFFIYTLSKQIRHDRKNDKSPVLTVDAKVVGKRADLRTYNRAANNNIRHRTSSTDYYVTFEVESGDRMELEVLGNEYGMLIEGDKGKLTFQGTRYKDFKRG